MRKLYDADSNEVEVLDEKEIQDLQEKAKDSGKLKEFNKKYSSLRKILDVKKGESLKDAIILAKESTNPNFKSMRAKIARLTTHIKGLDKDAKFDEEGDIVAKEEQGLDKEGVEKATLKTLADVEKKKLLAQYPEDKRKVIEKNFKKLMTGEEETPENMTKFMVQAGELSSVKQPDATTNPGGSDPTLKQAGDNFADSDKGKKAAAAIFGEESYANKDNK